MFLLPIGMFQQGLSRKYGVQLAMELGPILGYHAVLFIAHAAAYIYDCKYIVTNETETVFTYRGYGGKFKYLTNWNFVSPNIYLQLRGIMYTDMVIIVVYSATCTSYVLTQAKHAMVLYGRVNLGLYRGKKRSILLCILWRNHCISLFLCFHGYIIYGSTLVYNALVLNVHGLNILHSQCVSQLEI